MTRSPTEYEYACCTTVGGLSEIGWRSEGRRWTPGLNDGAAKNIVPQNYSVKIVLPTENSY